MSGKTIDIVTICKNSISTIEELLKSIRSNRNAINKFIVIDGNSDDGTIDVLNENLNIIDMLVSEEDHGISDAFNKGLKLSNADFVLLLNSDDYLIDGGLEQIRDQLRQNDEFVSTILTMKTGDEYFHYYSNIKNIRKFTSIYHPGLLVSNSVYKKYGYYDTGYKIGMDYELIVRSFVGGAKFRVIPYTLVVFADGGISRKHYFQAIKDGYRVRRKYFNIKFPDYELYKISFKLVSLAVSFLHLGRYTTNLKRKIYKRFFE